MSEEQKLTMAERVRLAKAKAAAEGGIKPQVAPKPASNMYTEEETKLVSDRTAERLKSAGSIAALAGKTVLDKSREATVAAKAKAEALLAEREAKRAAEVARAAEAAEQARVATEASVAVEREMDNAPAPLEIVLPNHDRVGLEVDPAPLENITPEEVREVLEVAPSIVVPEHHEPKSDYTDDMPAPPLDAAEEPRAGKGKLIIGALLVGALVVGGGYYFTRSEPTQPTVAQPANPIAPAPVSVEEPDTAKEPQQEISAPTPIGTTPTIDFSDPVPEVQGPDPSSYGGSSAPDTMPSPASEKIEAAPVEPKPAPAVVKPTTKPSAPPKPKPAAVSKPKPVEIAPKPKPTATEPDWQDKAIDDIEAFEKQLGG